MFQYEMALDGQAAPVGSPGPLDEEDYVVDLYPSATAQGFQVWLRDVDETILDMTGYSVHQFAVVPTFGGWSDWPVEVYDAALSVLRQDLWGQAFLGDLDLE
jgi:hypothetical protein